MRPRCSVLVSPTLTGGFDFSGCGDFTSCPPVERAEMSNSEPSAIVLHGIPCMCGLYKFRFERRNRRGETWGQTELSPICRRKENGERPICPRVSVRGSPILAFLARV